MKKQHLNKRRVSNSFFATLLCLAFAFNSPFAHSSPKPEALKISENQNKMMVPSDAAQSHKQRHQDEFYSCPMHPDEVSDKPGACSQCGMFLVAREQHDAPANGEKKAESQMPMQPKDKPALFWESEASRQSNTMRHSHSESGPSDEPMAERMIPEHPKAAAIAEQIIGESPAQTRDETAMEHARKHVDPTYVCPMHPQIVQGEPGSCPICGMDLVPKKSAAPAGDHPPVFLSAAMIQNMGVRTAKVQRKALRKRIRTQGIVTPDDERILFIHPRTAGWIETLHLNTEGDRVERKDVLVDFYSPWINQVQLDFITALEEYDLTSFDPSKKTELSAKVDSLRNSLRLLNVMDMDIMRIKNSRKVQNTIQLMAPQGGVITELRVREGTYVEPYQSMFTIVDLSQVWVMVDIYEHQAPWVRKGHRAKITAPAIPGKSWGGVVDFIYPEVDPKARTLRARIAVPNPDEALLLNMFVQVDLSANTAKHSVLTVPREAVIITGEREAVIKVQGKGHFQPLEVKTGLWGGSRVEILSGLQEGDEIVVSGQFLIDSESSLQASFLRMSE
jgi:Cu(I)/Ag(I) efflux system membrane fusion protein